MSADSVPSSKTNIFQSKLYTLIYRRHFRTYSRCAMFDWSDTVFRRRNVTRRRISNTVLQPRYWGSEANSPEVCRLRSSPHPAIVPIEDAVLFKLNSQGRWACANTNKPYKVGDGSVFIPDFPRFRYEWWCACFNKIKCRCGSKSS
jgi:hypothetical protein